MNKFLWTIGIVICLAGIGLTLFLTWAHFSNNVNQICSQQSGCNTVLNSSLATVLGLPTALWGTLYFVSNLFLILFYPFTRESGRGLAINGGMILSGAGSLIMIALTGYSLSVLGTTCSYCLTTLVLSLLLFGGFVFWRIRGSRDEGFGNPEQQTWQTVTVSTIVLALVISTVSIAWTSSQQQTTTETRPPNPVLAYDGRAIGQPDAPVTVVEFFDLECPACQAFTLKVFPKIKKNFIDKGKVLWTYRQFPLTSMHEHSLKAHIALSQVPSSQFYRAK
ncbi:MAG: thioredoxin domain-containing protein, partial [bacterium]